MTISAAIVVAISASQIPAVLAQTADLRLTTTINVGAGTGGADQLAVIVEIDTDVDFDIGTSAFRFFYNEPALDIPSGVSGGNQALVDGTDYEFLAGFQAGQFYFSNSVTTQGQLDRISANLGLANGAPTGTTIAAAAGWVPLRTTQNSASPANSLRIDANRFRENTGVPRSRILMANTL